MVHQLTNGSYKMKYHANGADKESIRIDFTPPFRCNVNLCESSIMIIKSIIFWHFVFFYFFYHYRRIDMIEDMAGLSIPKDLASEEANQYLNNACLKYDIKCAPLKKLLGCWIK